jgi:DNA-binding transcriptional LysR family regulator
MDLGNLDLNLLVCLDALLQERSVTRAACRLGRSQPTLSLALARLRRHFKDDLLTRVGNGYQLTPLGAHLKGLTSIAVAGVDRVFASRPDFDPTESRREFTVMTSDYGATIAGRALAAVVAERAPQVRLRLAQIRTDVVDRAQESLRTIDAMLLPHGFITDLPHIDLFQDRWVCVVAADNPAVGECLTMANLAELPWVLTFHEPTAFTPAARQLSLLGVDPQAQVIVESFLAVPFFVRGSDRVALLQERLARRLILDGGLRVLPCPFEVVPLVEALWWHPVHERDPEHMWLREVAAEAGRALERVGPVLFSEVQPVTA